MKPKDFWLIVCVGLVLVVLLVATVGCQGQANNAAARPVTVPGAVDPRVTQANIAQTICKRGYTATVRPPQALTEPIKRRLLPAGARLVAFQLDHAISLEVGGLPLAVDANGNPASFQPNLWDQPSRDATEKDQKVENPLHTLVCSGRMTLAAAQRCEWPDWRACEATIRATP